MELDNYFMEVVKEKEIEEEANVDLTIANLELATTIIDTNAALDTIANILKEGIESETVIAALENEIEITSEVVPAYAGFLSFIKKLFSWFFKVLKFILGKILGLFRGIKKFILSFFKKSEKLEKEVEKKEKEIKERIEKIDITAIGGGGGGGARTVNESEVDYQYETLREEAERRYEEVRNNAREMSKSINERSEAVEEVFETLEAGDQFDRLRESFRNLTMYVNIYVGFEPERVERFVNDFNVSTSSFFTSLLVLDSGDADILSNMDSIVNGFREYFAPVYRDIFLFYRAIIENNDSDLNRLALSASRDFQNLIIYITLVLRNNVYYLRRLMDNALIIENNDVDFNDLNLSEDAKRYIKYKLKDILEFTRYKDGDMLILAGITNLHLYFIRISLNKKSEYKDFETLLEKYDEYINSLEELAEKAGDLEEDLYIEDVLNELDEILTLILDDSNLLEYNYYRFYSDEEIITYEEFLKFILDPILYLRSEERALDIPEMVRSIVTALNQSTVRSELESILNRSRERYEISPDRIIREVNEELEDVLNNTSSDVVREMQNDINRANEILRKGIIATVNVVRNEIFMINFLVRLFNDIYNDVERLNEFLDSYRELVIETLTANLVD